MLKKEMNILKFVQLKRKNEKYEKLKILDDEKFNLLKSNEEFILSVTDKGFGKRSSAYEYRKTSRGGVELQICNLSERNGNEIVASFPISDKDQLMLVTDKGKLIRCPVNDIRIAGRANAKELRYLTYLRRKSCFSS